MNLQEYVKYIQKTIFVAMILYYHSQHDFLKSMNKCERFSIHKVLRSVCVCVCEWERELRGGGGGGGGERTLLFQIPNRTVVEGINLYFPSLRVLEECDVF